MDEPKTIGTAFIAYSSLHKNKEAIDWFRDVIEAVGIRCNLFDYGSTKPLPDKDLELIQKSHSFIALIFREDKIGESYSAAQWIHNEIGMAYALKKPILAFVESGVQMERNITDKITTFTPFDKDTLHRNVKQIILPLVELGRILQGALSSTQMYDPLFYRSVQSEIEVTESGSVIWSYESNLNILKEELPQIFHEFVNPFPQYSLIVLCYKTWHYCGIFT